MPKKTEKKSAEKNKVEELENHLKRALADYANLQRRVGEEKKEVVKFSNVILINKFLDVLDGLEAVQQTDSSEGLDLVIKKYKAILKNENVEEVPTENIVFDPVIHEGIGVVSGEKDGEIAEVLQKGYTIEGRVLRPARVKVTKKDTEG